MIRLVLGGERSGKSDLAYGLLLEAGAHATVLAMGTARDEAFRRQILDHRKRRRPDIPVVEPGLNLPEALDTLRQGGGPALVDSLDFWAFACLEAARDRTDDLVRSLDAWRGPLAPACILVSCEVGLGPLAATSFTRRFVRALGGLNQRLASQADEVRLAVAGIGLILKGVRDAPHQAD